ncbi:MAG TPA: ABC transporter permease [Jatrophihabitans sp.]|jgi:teichoic acid transport system permease protein|uniref:ABC transporter permease n=1 Tax=Jatrophihabitans sp. TaxID=1932789 RepID=UPI002DFEB8C7|nr:ABC transporter permease [Jatrophihabitans sp.]
MSAAREHEVRPEVAELVAKYGMRRAGARPPIVTYTRELWQRRHFITTFSTANNAVGYSDSILGQAWQLLTPLLNVAVYYLIFGLLLKTSRKIDNFIAFLVIGIFIFTFIQTAMLGGARAINANLALTRVLHFPRAVLPISSTLIALQRLLFSMVIMLPIVLLSGEPLRWSWLLLIPAIALQSVFCLGLAFIMARIGAKIPDTSQVLPFVLRTWLYVSGVFFAIQTVANGRPHWVKQTLEANPGAVYMQLVREALLTKPPSHPPYQWTLAVFWAIVSLVVGYIYFWKAEEQYGRV